MALGYFHLPLAYSLIETALAVETVDNTVTEQVVDDIDPIEQPPTLAK